MEDENQSNDRTEQPERDSGADEKDQGLESDDNFEEESDDSEQPEKDSQKPNDSESEDSDDESDDADDSDTIDIDGTKYTKAQIKSGLMMQSDYTKGKQELAEAQRELGRMIQELKTKPDKQENVDPEVQKALDLLKQHGFTTNEEIEKKFKLLQAQQNDERQFSEMLGQYPELKKHAEFIKAYGYQHSNMSWLDIAAKFRKTLGIENKKKLEKAKLKKEPKGSGGVKGKPKNEMTEIERKFEENLPRGFRSKS